MIEREQIEEVIEEINKVEQEFKDTLPRMSGFYNKQDMLRMIQKIIRRVAYVYTGSEDEIDELCGKEQG